MMHWRIWVLLCDHFVSFDEKIEERETGSFALPSGIAFVVEIEIGGGEGHPGCFIGELIER